MKNAWVAVGKVGGVMVVLSGQLKWGNAIEIMVAWASGGLMPCCSKVCVNGLLDLRPPEGWVAWGWWQQPWLVDAHGNHKCSLLSLNRTASVWDKGWSGWAVHG